MDIDANYLSEEEEKEDEETSYNPACCELFRYCLWLWSQCVSCHMSLFSFLTHWMLITWPGRAAAAAAAGVVELSKKSLTVNHTVIVGFICKYTLSVVLLSPRLFVVVMLEVIYLRVLNNDIAETMSKESETCS